MSALTVGSGLAASGRTPSYRHAEGFPDPFCDVASLAMPETMQDALKWCEFVFSKNGTYRQALDRVVSYFLTEIEVESEDREEKKKYKEFLYDQIGIQTLLHTVAMDYSCYGNSFTTVIVPIRRYLYCPNKRNDGGICGFELPLKRIVNNSEFRFRWSQFSFKAKCPRCGYQGEWKHNDRRSNDESDIRVKRWNPHEMELLWDPTTDDTRYIWKISEEDRKLIRTGSLFQLERTNWEIVQAVKNNQYLRFDDDIVYHMKEEALAGVRNRGWGISRVLSNFGQAWYVQVLHRYNEAIALDYVIPFRVITPAARSGAADGMGDPALHSNLGGFAGRVNSMVRAHRRDPAQWNVLPFPIEYQALGGDATQLAPRELLDQGIDVLLNSCGVPVEFYKGNLTVQSAPAALRLFEASWSHLVHNLNRFLQHLADNISRLMSWEPVKVRLQKVTHADDLNKQMAKLQLMMGQQISQSTGLKSVGMEFEEEQRQMIEEERFIAEEQAKMQEQLEQAAQQEQMAGGPAPTGGGMPPGGAAPPDPMMGAPMGGGGTPAAPAQPGDPAAAMGGGAAAQASGGFNVMQGTNPPSRPQTPEEMMAVAQQRAQELMGLPETQRKSELIKLKKEDPTMHSLVTSVIEDLRSEAQSVGGEQVLQQQFGYGGMGGGGPM